MLRSVWGWRDLLWIPASAGMTVGRGLLVMREIAFTGGRVVGRSDGLDGLIIGGISVLSAFGHFAEFGVAGLQFAAGVLAEATEYLVGLGGVALVVVLGEFLRDVGTEQLDEQGRGGFRIAGASLGPFP